MIDLEAQSETVEVPRILPDEIADFLEYNIIWDDVDLFWAELLKLASALSSHHQGAPHE